MSHSPETAAEEFLDRVDALATLPHAAYRVIELAEDDGFSAYDLAGVIATDAGLTAKILRLANSPFYGYPRQITTVRDAVVLLGFRAVRSTAISAAVVDVLPAENARPFDSDLFWGHSTACAVVAEALAKEAGVRPDVAFTAGILHDVGRILLAQYEPQRFAQVLHTALREEVHLHVVEEEEFGCGHALLGGRLAQRWNLPGELVDAIERHHQMPPDGQGPTDLQSAVALANAVCNERGLWCGLDTDDGDRVFHVPVTDLRVVSGILSRELGGAANVEDRVREFLRQAIDRDVRWYRAPVEASDEGEAA